MSEAEFEKLVAKIRPELVRIATRRCGRDFAEDAVQKTVMRVWVGARWKTADRPTVTARLRALVSLNGRDEFRQVARFRDAQRNLVVLTHKGGRRVAPAGGADRQADEIQRAAQRRQEAGQ